MRHELPGQQSFDFYGKHTPFNCEHESAVVDIGGGKSFCDLWQRWTNCREVGHCVYQSIGGDN